MGYLRNDWEMKTEDDEFKRPLSHEEEQFRQQHTPGPRRKTKVAPAPRGTVYQMGRRTK